MSGTIVISKSFVDSTTKPGDYRDSKLPGFILRVGKQSKSYIVNSKMKGTKKQVSVSLGKHGVITAKQARELAAEALHQIKQGMNPNEMRRDAAHQRNIVEELTLERVLESYLDAKLHKQSTNYSYKVVIGKHFQDWLKKPITDITPFMVESRHKEISTTHKTGANTAMRYLRALYNYASSSYTDKSGSSIVTSNPVSRLSKLKLWNRDQRRIDYIRDHELKSWFAAVQGLEDSSVADYLILTLMSGLRKMEGLSLRWDCVDLKSRTFAIPETKTHARHELPITEYLLDLFERRLEARESDYVFPGLTIGSHLKDPRNHVQEVARVSGVAFRLHDLRRTFSTLAAHLGISPYIIKRLLNHKLSNDITASYVVSDVESVREAMELVNRKILMLAQID